MSILRVRDADGNIQEILAIKGEPGQNATVNIGTVISVPHDANATVTNSGTTTAAILNFEIPRGVDGVSPIVIEPYYDENVEGELLSPVEFETIKEAFKNGISVIAIYDYTVYKCVSCSDELATFTSMTKEDNPEEILSDSGFSDRVYRFKTITIDSNNIVDTFAGPPFSEESVPTFGCMERYVYQTTAEPIYELQNEVNSINDSISILTENISSPKIGRVIVELNDMGEGTYFLSIEEESIPDSIIVEEYLYDMYCNGHEIYLRYNETLCHCISCTSSGYIIFELTRPEVVNGYLKQKVQHFIYNNGNGYFTDETTLESLNIIDGKVKLNLTSIGDIALTDSGKMVSVDTDSMEHLHTIYGTAVVVPANTLITLTSFRPENYEGFNVPVYMYVYYSYDNGNSYQLKELNEDDPKFYTEQEAVIAFSIDCSQYIDEEGFTYPAASTSDVEQLIVIDIYTVSEHIKDTDEHFNNQDAHGLDEIKRLLSDLAERVSELEKLISHGTAEPDSSTTSTYYIKHD